MKGALGKEQVVRDWLAITLRELRKKISKMKVKDTGTLSRTFETHILKSAGDDIQKIKILYQYYGAFVDMGVGRGTGMGGVKENSISRRLEGKMRGNSRRPKRWYSPTMYNQVNRLATIMARHYADTGQLTIKESLPAKIEINL